MTRSPPGRTRDQGVSPARQRPGRVRGAWDIEVSGGRGIRIRGLYGGLHPGRHADLHDGSRTRGPRGVVREQPGAQCADRYGAPDRDRPRVHRVAHAGSISSRPPASHCSSPWPLSPAWRSSSRSARWRARSRPRDAVQPGSRPRCSGRSSCCARSATPHQACTG